MMTGQHYKKAMGALKTKKADTLAEHLVGRGPSPKTAAAQQTTKAIVIGAEQISTESS